ncbi:MAG: (2Fe-2S)-binding protein [Pseudomonadota bacterium]
MIICQCNIITDLDFENAVITLLSGDPDLTVTPGRVIRALNARRQCSGCLPALNSMIDTCKKQCHSESCPRQARRKAHQKMPTCAQ